MTAPIEPNVVYKEIPNSSYHSAAGLSASGLKELLRSPEHYQAHLQGHKTRTPAMAFGSLFHTATMEPEKLAAQYVMEPAHINKRTKAGKAEYEAFLKASEGKEVIDTDQLEKANCMAAAVFSNVAAELLFLQGEVESSIWWNDPVTGVRCKCRPDLLDLSRRIIVDLKSAEDASPSGFARACAMYKYHVQAAHYCEGVYRATGTPCSFVLVAVEKKPPYSVGVYELDPDSRELGYQLRAKALAIFKECLESGLWPGYSSKVNELSLPKWAFY